MVSSSNSLTSNSLTNSLTSSDLELIDISKRIGPQVVVRPLTLTVRAGEFVAIMGPSGCGKTTLLRLIAGLASPSSGQIRLGGVDISNRPVNQRNTPMVWQNFALFPHLRVQQNIAFGLTLRSHNKAEVQRKVETVAAMVGLGDLLKRRVDQLSGGQKQRVALARALVTEPPILLLDEPMSALDAHLRLRMQGELKRLQQTLGISFIYVTHNQNEAFAMADRVVVMNQGRIEQVGSPTEIYTRPTTHFVAEFVGNNNLLDGTLTDLQPDTLTVKWAQGQLIAHRTDKRHKPGEAVTAVVPADKFVTHPHPDYPNHLKATVRGREFLGSQISYLLDTATGQEIKMVRQEAFSQPPLPVNTEVDLFWRVEDTLLLGEVDPLVEV